MTPDQKGCAVVVLSGVLALVLMVACCGWLW